MNTSAEAVESAPTIAPDVRAAHDAAVERDFWRNAAVSILFDGIWALGMSFAILVVLIPAYLAELAAPKILVGITVSIITLMVPLQLLSERLVGGARRLGKLWLLYTACGVNYIVMALIAWVLPAEPSGWRITNFMLGVIVFVVLTSLGGPVYGAVLTDNCPVYRRGRLYGYRSAALGIMGLLGLWPARWIVSQFDGAASYHVAILGAGVMFIISSLSVMLFRDHVDPERLEHPAPRTIRGIVAEAVTLVRNLWATPNYRVFMFFMIILYGAASLSAFVVSATRDLLNPAGDLSMRFRLAFLIAMLFNAVFLASADRWGYQITIILQGLLGVGGFALAQASGRIEGIMLAYGMLMILTQGINVSLTNLSVELLPHVSPAHLVAAGNLFCLPSAVVLPWLAGSLIDLSSRTAAPNAGWGYPVVFAIGIALAAVGVLGTALLVQEPRTGRVYVIKRLERG